MSKLILLRSQEGDWEGLYIGGALVEEGHDIGEGNSTMFWFELGQTYTDSILKIYEVNDADEQILQDEACFPEHISMLTGDYYE